MTGSFSSIIQATILFIKRCCIIMLITFILIEMSLRAFFAYRIGPDILFYGTSFSRGFGEERYWNKVVKETQSVSEHTNMVKNYSKYYPYQKRFDYDPKTGEVFNVSINGNGFRGKDYLKDKQNDVLRIATLGGSSTFGYGDRDNETYPYYLEENLRSKIIRNSKSIPYKDVEVINFGIPHLTSDKILSLFNNEVLQCQPDIVTFYEGINDTTRNVGVPIGKIQISKEKSSGMVMKQAKDRLLILALTWEILKANKKYSHEYYENQFKEKGEFFIDNISKIRDACLKNNITFIIITQQAQSCTYDAKNITYEAEVDLLENKLIKHKLTYTELCFLFHSKIMNEVKKWAFQNKINIIDGIEVLDNHRSCLTSWVHLTPTGNRILADAIADKVYLKIH